MNLELGGGNLRARGNGWINVDLCDVADVRHDLNVRPWPFADDSVDALYSSHCLEHLSAIMDVLYEIARICKVGAAIELRVPHPSSDLAMVWDHRHVYGPIAAINNETYFPHEVWPNSKRLKLISIEYGPSILLEEAKRELPFLAGLSDEVIMKYVPRTCHECIFHYMAVINEFYVAKS